jgi:hypothetical protein
MSKKNEQEKGGELLLNKQIIDPPTEIDRGVELMLRNRNKKEEPKTFQFKINHMIGLFKRECHLNIDLTFDIKKKP